MSIQYVCRHCGMEMAKINESVLDSWRLGFDILSTEEREEMVNYEDNGNIFVKAICEDCQEALDRNPSYHELDSFIQ
ncbi:anti-sigma-F factor Fin family protein [Bacillus carboniphilus]|uniref:Anti-sigma-F factor Fin family protein n=1 Tax=Bacillus carboniphilus TaxID=86663 RepID=A0ABY9JUE5_9BACI|nr:anti-sigma-F factor Fin family protein [Bacillus carboniphilus]WLR41928.1 anti-sigma-F factor Fin family protein [Bacillus carboniphilus]